MKNLSQFNKKISIIGAGGFGTMLISQVAYEKSYSQYKYLSIGQDSTDWQKNPNIESIVLSADNKTKVSNDQKWLKQIQEHDFEIRTFLSNSDIALIVFSSGKNLSSVVSPFVAKVAKEIGVLTIAISFQPFNTERRGREDLTFKTEDNLILYSDMVIPIKKQFLFDITESDTALASSIELLKDPLRGVITTISDVIKSVQNVNFDLSDFKNICANNGYGFITKGESSAFCENPVLEALENALGTINLREYRGAENVLLNIKGGDSLRISDIDTGCKNLLIDSYNGTNIKYSFTYFNEMKHINVQVIM